MSMIRVENITFSYPSSFDPVFENVSFQIDTEWKLGLVWSRETDYSAAAS